MYFAIKDAVLVALTYASVVYLHRVSPLWMWWPIMLTYWAVQGTLFTAIFVIGHDCGHDSFSHSKLLNTIVGQIYHGFLVCPYYMWKMSHRIHHKNNCNMDKDEVFYPLRRSSPNAEGSPVPAFGFGLGWFGYLVLGYQPRPINHFNITSNVFKNDYVNCVISLLICGGWSCCLYKYAANYGFCTWLNYYFVPLFIFASYCVIITFLHHSEINIPWYSDGNWDFVRGQLSTVDRDYGMVHYMIHNIGTHQIHHMFTKVPHYHLEEATYHFRKNFPELVRICDEPILPSYMRMFRKYVDQIVVDDDAKTHVYH